MQDWKQCVYRNGLKKCSMDWDVSWKLLKHPDPSLRLLVSVAVASEMILLPTLTYLPFVPCSEGRRKRGKPSLGGSRTILWPATVSGRGGRANHHDRPARGGRLSPWCDLPGREWKSGDLGHHQSACYCHGNLTSKKDVCTSMWVCLLKKEHCLVSPSCLVCVWHGFRWGSAAVLWLDGEDRSGGTAQQSIM